QLPRTAIEVATRLILDVAGGQAGPVVEAALDAHLAAPRPIVLRRARLARVLGLTVADAEVGRILRALGMEVTDVDQGWRVLPPSRRFDIAIEEDLIEEVARIHGYESIPTTLPGGAARIAAPSETRVDDDALRAQLVAREYFEAVSFAFLDANLLQQWGATDGAVALANPLSAELGVMRTALLPGLVAALGRNLARQQSRVRLFEVGKVFGGRGPGTGGTAEAGAAEAGAPVETLRVAAVAAGDAVAEQWDAPARGGFPRSQGRPGKPGCVCGGATGIPAVAGRARASGAQRGGLAHRWRRAGAAGLDRRTASAPAARAGPGRPGAGVRSGPGAAVPARDSASAGPVALSVRPSGHRVRRPGGGVLGGPGSHHPARWGRAAGRGPAVRPLSREGGRSGIQKSRNRLDSAG